MIVMKYTGDNGKPTEMTIHAGIIKNFKILSNSLVLEFKRSNMEVKQKKGEKNMDFAWTWTKNINDIINYTEVMKFLKTLDFGAGHAKVIKKIIKENDDTKTQGSLF